MKYLFDTNICIYLIKRKPQQVLARFESCLPGEVGISSVTLAELAYGVAKSQLRERNQQALEKFVLPLEVAVFDAQAASAYGPLRAELERRGTPIGPLDLMIAAQALSLRTTLVTNNTREFARVGGDLRLENWTDT